MLECPHTDVRRSRVVRDGQLLVLCPACVDTWEGPSVGPPPTAWAPPQVDDASLAEEFDHLRKAKLLVEHTEQELAAARRYFKMEAARIRRHYGTPWAELGAQLNLSRSAVELCCKYVPGEGYMFTAQRESKAREDAANRAAVRRAKAKARAVRAATTGVGSVYAEPDAPPDRSADRAVQHQHQAAPGATG